MDFDKIYRKFILAESNFQVYEVEGENDLLFSLDMNIICPIHRDEGRFVPRKVESRISALNFFCKII